MSIYHTGMTVMFELDDVPYEAEVDVEIWEGDNEDCDADGNRGHYRSGIEDVKIDTVLNTLTMEHVRIITEAMVQAINEAVECETV